MAGMASRKEEGGEGKQERDGEGEISLVTTWELLR